ncbi:tRNA (adenosine(37)-N6)-threonylcarbamoyltransferase complex dimerization subunit type 1 TsaB [Granulicella cerasi]|uniref:tRNA (Adenosine(37)-N6)-threonylcarbamoyltransferase complex dimerization subunit type 1 TsaB n=1 Tax=Granulicella cerasi TaxID=741063 RepID=A0ABW1Z3X1_9BACT|nr:tRNA (adenosine(37)-N6)-threonylcarbamoyltransferase complex dimerization subunit type 1 TsaB [Granulicella cerasi]
MTDANAQNVLWLDTCGAPSRAALFVRGELSGENVLPDRTASADLVSAMRELLGVERVTAVVVVSGPGSFTGVRVGLSAAKALCEVWDVPLYAVSRLAVLAAGAELGFAAMDAGRGQLYVRDLATTRESLEDFASFVEKIVESSSVVIAESPLANKLPNAVAREVSVADAWPLIQDAVLSEAANVALLDANYVRSESEIYAKKPAIA